MREKLIFRKANRNDRDNWIRLKEQIHHLHVLGEPLYFCDMTYDQKNDAFDKFLNEDNTDIILAQVENNTMVGYMVIMRFVREEFPGRKKAKNFIVDEICIDEIYRERGIGRELINIAIKMAGEEGYDNVELGVRGFNRDAILFYRSLGMEEVMIRFQLRI